MLKTRSSKGKYVLAALVGAAAGGIIVGLSTRAVPKMMSGMMAKCKRMMAKCKRMMAGMAEADGDAGDMCQRMMAGMG